MEHLADGAVTYEIEGEIAVLTVANPPVNALSGPVRQGLDQGLKQALADPAIRAILLMGAGRTFPAGADISEFDKPPFAEPWVPELCNRIEASDKLVIAALHGTALGGGFEIALAAHYRVALKDTRFGLPEVTLGLLPGAGGTQRTPRLGGAKVALDLMLSGRPVLAQSEAGRAFFDAVYEEDLRGHAIGYAARLIEDKAPIRRTRDARDGFADPMAYQQAIAERRKSLEGKPEIAPREILRCVEAAALLPFDIGLEFESSAFTGLLQGDQSKALRHAFFAERRAARIPEAQSGRPREVHQIGLLGGGLMGAGIAIACLDAGYRVTLLERDSDALAAGLARINAIYDRAVSRGRLSQARRDARLERLDATLDMRELAEADLVIEAVIEDIEVKRQVFASLGAVTKPGAVLVSNTSYLDVNEFADASGREADVLGMHFFSPAHVMRLVEVVVTDKVSADAVATVVAVARRLRKIPLRSGVTDGFIGNRLLSAYRTASEYMVEDGATPYEIDKAMRAFGMKLGPFEVSDMAGLDIAWARRKRLAPTRDPEMRYVAIADYLCEMGRLGQKTGSGYYLYEAGSRAGKPDPDVLRLIEEERAAMGIKPRKFTTAEIQRRCLAAMANEGARLLREGIAVRPSDIDVVMIHGYGFPRWRGGPMKAADLIGLMELRLSLQDYAREDAVFWAPDPVFAELEKNGETFESLNG